MHWGLYSVPAFGSSEWFWGQWKEGFQDHVDFMNKNYKPGFEYQDFADGFHAEFFNATRFAELVKLSGAK